jgi:flagellar biosynthesis/type III secretory pathway M-ring protein FliF/YscJ
MQLADVEQIIRNALGLRETDALKVVNVKFHRPNVESMIEPESSGWSRIMTIVRHASLGIMAICALLVLRIFRGAKAKVASTAPTGQLPGTEGSVGFLQAEAGASESLVLRRQISGALQRNPEQVKQLFSSWLEDRGG